MRGDRVALAVAMVVAACSRSGLDAFGGVGEDGRLTIDATAHTPGDEESPALGDDVSTGRPIDANAGAGNDGYALTADGDAMPESEAAPDAPPEIPCLERTVVNCDCESDVCEPQRIRLQDAIESNVGGCLGCLENLFTFDANGCVTAFSHPQWHYTNDDACLQRDVGAIRFSCTAGVSEPFSFYHSCTVM